MSNSLNGRHSLTIRLLLLLFLLSPFTGACNAEPSADERKAITQLQDPEDLRTDTMATKKAKALVPATIDLLGNPFIADFVQSNKLEAYYTRINTTFTVEADAIENMHRPSISDTIYTIRFGESVLELYAPTQTGSLLLQEADIRNAGIVLRNNMKVGMTQPELMNKLKAHNVRILQTSNEVVATSVEGAPTALRFYIKNGKVNRIRYEGYLD
jgi:hypothetical protein